MCQQVKLSDVSLGTRSRYSVVVDEDVKKPNKQALGVAGGESGSSKGGEEGFVRRETKMTYIVKSRGIEMDRILSAIKNSIGHF